MTTPLAFGDADAKSSLWWLPVAMIGFGAPAVLMTLISPSTVDMVRFVIAGVLAIMSIAAAAIYVVAVLMPGDAVAAVFDRAQGQLRIVWVNPFASKVETLGFEAVRDVALTTRYDDDGYAEEAAEAKLDDGRIVRLPGAVRQADVDAVRAALGLAPQTTATSAQRRLR